MRINQKVIIKSVVLLALIAGGAWAFDQTNSDAADGVDNLTCGRCHRDFDINAGYAEGGDFFMDDCGARQTCSDLFKRGYVPGRIYDIRVIIQQPGMASWGFDAWVIDQDGQKAGTLQGVANRTAVHNRTHNGITLMQGAVGNEGARFRHNGRYDGPLGWRFRWTAPSENIGPVRFLAEGIAASLEDAHQRRAGGYRYYLNGITVSPAPDEK